MCLEMFALHRKNVMPMPLGNLEGHGVMLLSAYGTCQRRIGYRTRRALGYMDVGKEHWAISKWRSGEPEI